MAMTKREKLLATGVAAIAGLFGGNYVINTVSSGFEEQQADIDRTKGKIEKLDDVIFQGKLDAKKLEKVRSKSLPSDPERVLATYTTWLTEIGDSVGIRDLYVGKYGRPIPKDAYTQYSFELKGKCKTDQVVELLAQFYDQDFLHTIESLQMNPVIRERDVFELTLRARALALKGAPKEVTPSEEPSGRLKMDVDEYKDVILARNPFSPPNEPPRIETDSRLEIVLGDRWSESLKASDQEGHQVNFELVDAPEGVELNGSRLNFSPEETGEYLVTVRASDTGWPSMSTEKRIRLVVNEPEKEEEKVEPPKFDEATIAFASAILQSAKGPQLFVRVPTASDTLKLYVGDKIDVGSVQAEVISIDPLGSYVELQTGDRRWTLGMDESLAEAFKKSEID